MNREFEQILFYCGFFTSTNMVRHSYRKILDDIYFVPTAANGGFFAEWKGRNLQPTVICEESLGEECLKNIFKYSEKKYEDWIDSLIDRNNKLIQDLTNNNEELEQRKIKIIS